MTEPAIRTENLSCRFGQHDAVRALNLEVPANSIYAFLGPNGAGKSTTLSVLINALRPTSGRAFLLGRESAKLRASDFARIGYVAENQKLPEWMTGEQTLAFLKPFYPKWDDAFEDKLQRTLDIPLSRKVAHMSRGERMKLRLLSSMAYRPSVLILDEPFSGLDPSVREDLSSGLLELVGEEDWTVILASHDVDELERLVDHAGFIKNGSLCFSESTESLQSRFQKVTAKFSTQPILEQSPSTWSAFEQAEQEIRFVDEAYEESQSRADLSLLGSLERVEARPLTLREIFVNHARGQRDTGKEQA
jgi:ABC-2 type transport system ATP-binding protein